MRLRIDTIPRHSERVYMLASVIIASGKNVEAERALGLAERVVRVARKLVRSQVIAIAKVKSVH